MTSLEVIDTDTFLDMPVSSQLLYFHLNARADDDGFVSNPRKISKSVGAADDDLKILISKKFILAFEDGVVVIKHWRINNFVRKDLYRETKYLDHKNALFIRANGAYTLTEDGRATKIPHGHYTLESVNDTLTGRQLREGKGSVGKIGEQSSHLEEVTEEPSHSERKPKAKYANALIAFSWLPNRQKSWDSNLTELECGMLLYERGEEAVKKFVKYVEAHKYDDGFGWRFVKPSDYERKWEDIKFYAART